MFLRAYGRAETKLRFFPDKQCSLGMTPNARHPVSYPGADLVERSGIKGASLALNDSWVSGAALATRSDHISLRADGRAELKL